MGQGRKSHERSRNMSESKAVPKISRGWHGQPGGARCCEELGRRGHMTSGPEYTDPQSRTLFTGLCKRSQNIPENKALPNITHHPEHCPGNPGCHERSRNVPENKVLSKITHDSEYWPGHPGYDERSRNMAETKALPRICQESGSYPADVLRRKAAWRRRSGRPVGQGTPALKSKSSNPDTESLWLQSKPECDRKEATSQNVSGPQLGTYEPRIPNAEALLLRTKPECIRKRTISKNISPDGADVIWGPQDEVIPAKAGIHHASRWKGDAGRLDSRSRGNDFASKEVPA
jgi:hypothetical protein